MTWKVQIVSLSEQEAVAVESLEDRELVEELIEGGIGDYGWESVEEAAEDVGISVSVDVDVGGVIDNTKFVVSFLDRYVEEEYLRAEDVEPGSWRRDVGAGHPDYIIEKGYRWECPKCRRERATSVPPAEVNHCGRCGGELDIDEDGEWEDLDNIYMELKKGNDSLRKSQQDWIIKNLPEGKRIWIMTVEEE